MTADLLAWLSEAPSGVSVVLPAELIREIVQRGQHDHDGVAPEGVREVSDSVTPGRSTSARFWNLPPETRLSVRDLAAALGVSVAWVYKRSGAKSTFRRLPHETIGGRIEFIAGDIRAHLEQYERHVRPASTAVVPIARGRRKSAMA